MPRPVNSTRKMRNGTGAARRRFLAESDGLCHMHLPGCTGKATTVDDIKPLIVGGVDEPSNWRPACEHCNKSAGAKLGNRIRGQRKRKSDMSDSSEVGRNSGPELADSPRRRATRAPRKAQQLAPIREHTFDPLKPCRPRVARGLIQPRFEHPPRRPRSKTLGPEAAEWIEASGIVPRGQKLYAWQRHALNRMLELNPDGTLRFQVIVLTISRQQGKSVLARGYLWWRIHQGERFGEQQVVVHIANRHKTAREVWRPAARVAVGMYGKTVAKYGKGDEQIDLSDVGGGRWLVQAANEDTAIGFSVHGGLVDEAWNVKQDVVDDALTPAMSETEQPLLVLVSTAGVDDESDLLRSYRDAALADVDCTGDVLLLEWSAPPEAPWDHPDTWRWASPNWTPRRERFLRSQMMKAKAAGGIAAFKRQYLNQWTATENPWIPADVWALGYAHPELVDKPMIVAVESSPEFDRYGIVTAWRVDDEHVFVRAEVTYSTATLWERVAEIAPRRVLLPPSLHVHYKGRIPAVMVGTREISLHLGVVHEAIRAGQLLHDAGNEALNDDIARAVPISRPTGFSLSNVERGKRLKDGVRKPIECARAMVWAAGEVVRGGVVKPMFRAG